MTIYCMETLQALIDECTARPANGFGDDRRQPLRSALLHAAHAVNQHPTVPVLPSVMSALPHTHPLSAPVFNVLFDWVCCSQTAFAERFDLDLDKEAEDDRDSLFQRFELLTSQLGDGISVDDAVEHFATGGFSAEASQFESEVMRDATWLHSITKRHDNTTGLYEHGLATTMFETWSEPQYYEFVVQQLSVLLGYRLRYFVDSQALSVGAAHRLIDTFVVAMQFYIAAFRQLDRLRASDGAAVYQCPTPPTPFECSTASDWQQLALVAQLAQSACQSVLAHASTGLFSFDCYFAFFSDHMLTKGHACHDSGFYSSLSDMTLLPFDYAYDEVLRQAREDIDPDAITYTEGEIRAGIQSLIRQGVPISPTDIPLPSARYFSP